MQKTTMLKPKEIKRQWYKIDASGIVLGKLAVKAANILRGKNKIDFTPNVDCGDYLIITNCNKVILTANKKEDKFWYDHSGFIGGLRKRSGKVMLAKYSDELVTRAIKGMLPKNRLSNKIITKLHAYKKETDKHDAQKPQLIKVGK